MLAVAAQTPIILAAAKVLDVKLGGWMSHHFGEHASTCNERPADLDILRAFIEQHSLEL
jgi:hypothetical protein